MFKSKTYKIRHLDPGEYNLWDQFITQAAHPSIFFTTDWAEIIKSATGRDFRILILFKDQSVVGGLLYWPKEIAGIKAITLAAVTPYQGIIVETDKPNKSSSTTAAEHDITKKLLEYLQNHFDYIDLMLPPGINDIRPYLWRNFQETVRYTYRFPILSTDELQHQFNTNLKRKIKKYNQSELKIQSSKDIFPLLDFIFLSYKQHGLQPVLPRQQLKQIFSLMLEQKLARVFYVLDKEKPIAGIIAAIDSECIYYFFAGMSDEFRKNYNSDFLFSGLLSLPEFQGRIFDFMGANTQELEQFKRSFGGDLQSHYRVVYHKNLWIKLLTSIRRKQHLWKRKSRGNA